MYAERGRRRSCGALGQEQSRLSPADRTRATSGHVWPRCKAFLAGSFVWHQRSRAPADPVSAQPLSHRGQTAPAFFTALMMPLTFNISHGLAAGIVVYALVKTAARRRDEVHWLVYLLAVLFVLRYALLPV